MRVCVCGHQIKLREPTEEEKQAVMKRAGYQPSKHITRENVVGVCKRLGRPYRHLLV